ncbi:polysaccharide deacetylase family protein [Paenibacillus sp. HN-1]|uniref:polysaccharide deacetylase family protein n=1 Tax=Paenibacillus TaxID=44249 RepID=UPI001CA95046|nr:MULTISPECIES: polysaccharide deacetylase family protein [Paenibacillus]MBY9081936.1 polysaccharide deacetylase family protein [Paenibacillus sp. CGMCC 1.18879]MBY9085906.1 polysaccharide deacetylase family protein [Paenibacillus sinensis]
MKLEKAAVALACMAVIIGLGTTSGPIKDMLAQQRMRGEDSALPAMFADKGDELRSRIEARAAQLKEAPVDAKVDRIWKAIPGYNGLEVDVEGTYRKALLLPAGSPIPYVYKQTPPSVTLDELGVQPIYRGNPAKPMVAFMINVAWGNEYLIPMLDILDQEKVKATFFLDGSWLSKNRELALEIKKRGHEIENHAYTHPNMSTLSRARATMEIEKTKSLLKSSLDVENRWFAPPSGDFDQETVEIAHELGLKTVLWTLDTVDWRNPSPDSVITKITTKAEPGTLVLMHPTNASSKALRGMIRGIRAKGLTLGTVSETLSSERVLPESVE